MAVLNDAPTVVAARLLAELPDTPRWLETRGMLRSPHATVTGGSSATGGFVVRLVHGALSAVAVVGRPPAAAIVSALDGTTPMTPVLTQSDNADYVREVLPNAWKSERFILHRLTAAPKLPELDPAISIRLLTRDDRLDHLQRELRHEMTHARGLAPVAAAFVDSRASSFCYPVWTTESLWDVSIDTVPDQQGRGLAGHVVRCMIAHLRDTQPVWGALESNTASLRLAAKLGFTPVDESVAFSRGPWAFLTGGFDFTGR